MIITDLKVTGFKSFVEPVRLQIEPGLTGIVGPNGCGKSNVLESLRWVMGATSARALRGAGMDDVIFSGTDRRPARDIAEVTITIDNRAGRAPAPFQEAPSLEVSRKIRRGAGSVFRINGKEVRARDVQLLFADASTGANSPALVRQGQVSELIGAKPENRRRILEEAAGISGLYARRHEAELRLRAAELNLEKLDQLLEHLGEQLKVLQRQARQAARYRLLADEIRGLEAFLLSLRRLEARQAIEAAQKEAKERDLAVADAMRASLGAQRGLEEADGALGPAREEQAIAEAVLRRLEGRRGELDRALEQARAAVAGGQADLKRIDDDSAREQRMVDDASLTLTRLGEEIAALPQASPEAERAAQENLEAALSAADGRRQSAEDALAAARSNIARRDAQAAAARQAASEAQTQLDRRKQALAAAKVQLDQMVAALPDGSALAAARAAVEKAQAASLEALENADRAEADADRLAAAEAEARAAAQAAQSQLASLTSERDGLQAILRRAPKSAHRAVLEDLRPAAGFEKALAAALGDDLQGSTEKAADIVWTGAEKPDIVWPFECVVLGNHVQGPAELAARLAAVAVVDAATFGNLPALPTGARVVTKAGDLARWDGFVRKAGAVAGAAAILEQRGRLEALAGLIAPLEEQSRALAAGAAQARAATASAQANARNLRGAAPQALARLAREREQAAKLEVAESQIRAKAEAARDGLAVLEAEVSAATLTLQERNAALNGLSGDDTTDAPKLAALVQAVEATRQEAADARAALSDWRRASAQLAGQRNRLAAEQADWTRRKAEAATRITQLGRERFAAETRIAGASAIPAEVSEKRNALLAEMPRAEQRQRAATDALVEAETRLRALRDAVRSGEAAAAGAREARALVQARLEAMQMRLADLDEEVARKLGFAPDELERRAAAALGDKATNLDKASAQSKLDRALRDREALGGVNLQAEDEAGSVGERINGLTADRDDLTAAIAKLRGGVDEINAEGRERLIKAFDKVHGHFRVLFETLFGGGTAELQLTESDDPLGGGLEVYACPPGKKLQSMSLMSGGEQALTAAALIFAVFLSNPAPVCVLDEVDAPLDDANVDRFCLMLEQMRKDTDTRFIVITHHPITMARMDRLFGVTMAERGVSQVVSVDLQRAEALIGA
jgi:chromosome segregation protein